MSKCLMTKSLFKCIVITIVSIFVTLSSAHEGLKLCRRIKSNSLKVSAMGPLGATDFVLLTSEGHLFIVPKSNLLNVGQPSMNLYLDRVPISDEQVFRVKLNYTKQPYHHIFIVHHKESKCPLLVTAQGDKLRGNTIFRAFHFEWNRNNEDSRSALLLEISVLFDATFMMNCFTSHCADAYFGLKTSSELEEYTQMVYQTVCLEHNGISIKLQSRSHSKIGPFSYPAPIQTGFELPLDGIFHRFALLDSGEIHYTRDGTPNPRPLCLLKDFIQCGPGFRDETDRWLEPTPKKPKEIDPESPNVVSTEATQPNDGQPSNIIWILLVVAVLVLVVA